MEVQEIIPVVFLPFFPENPFSFFFRVSFLFSTGFPSSFISEHFSSFSRISLFFFTDSPSSFFHSFLPLFFRDYLIKYSLIGFAGQRTADPKRETVVQEKLSCSGSNVEDRRVWSILRS